MNTLITKTIGLLLLGTLTMLLCGCTVTYYGPRYNYDSPHEYQRMQRFQSSGTETPYIPYRPRWNSSELDNE